MTCLLHIFHESRVKSTVSQKSLIEGKMVSLQSKVFQTRPIGLFIT